MLLFVSLEGHLDFPGNVAGEIIVLQKGAKQKNKRTRE